MKLIGFKNEELTSPYSPSWHFCIGEKDNIGIDCNELKEFLLSKEEEVLSIKNKEVLDHAFGTKLGKNSTTARAGMFNVFDWDHPQLTILKNVIVECHNEYYKRTLDKICDYKLWCNCWVNIMRKGDRIKKHAHGYGASSYLSGHFTVSCSDTKTIYMNPYDHLPEEDVIREVREQDHTFSDKLYVSENNVDKISIFPNYVPHFTTEHTQDDERITLAFDLIPRYNNYCNL